MKILIRLFSHPVVFIAALLIMAVFMTAVLPAQARKAAEYTPEGMSFDTSFFYAPAAVPEMIASFGESGRAAYIRARWTFDLLFPFVYGFFCLSAAAFGLSRLKTGTDRWRYLVLLPLLAVGFDLLENSFVTVLMRLYPEGSPLLALLAAGSTLCKWIAVILSFSQALILPVTAWVLYRKATAAESR